MKVLTIKDIKFIEPIIKLVRELVIEGLKGGALEIRILRESKTRIQEEKYHAMIGDIAKTVKVYGKLYDGEIWKAQLVDEFRREKEEMGEPLTHPGKTVVSLDGQRMITVRPSTKKFRKKEASDFIEFLYATGIEFGAKFSEKALEHYHEIQQG